LTDDTDFFGTAHDESGIPQINDNGGIIALGEQDRERGLQDYYVLVVILHAVWMRESTFIFILAH